VNEGVIRDFSSMVLVPTQMTVKTNGKEQEQATHLMCMQHLVGLNSIWKSEKGKVTVTLVLHLSARISDMSNGNVTSTFFVVRRTVE